MILSKDSFKLNVANPSTISSSHCIKVPSKAKGIVAKVTKASPLIELHSSKSNPIETS
jgi:hypothetical protein